MEILGSLILSVTHSILFYGKEIGISMILFTILGNVILYYILSKKNKIINKKGFVLLIPIVLISFTYFIYANTTLQMLNIFALLILNIIMYSIVVGEKNNALVMHLYSALEIAKNTIEDYLEVIKYSNKKVKEHIKIGKKLDDNKIKRVGMSLLIVLGVCLIIVILLASADSIFAGIFSNIGNAFSKINIGTFILRIGILIVVYFLILSYILNLQKKIELKVKKQKKAKAEEVKAQLEKITLEFKVKTGEGGRVFGSVSTKQICEELQKKHSITVDKRKFLDTESIQSLGFTYVKVDLYRNQVIGNIKVHVSEA